MQEIIIDGEKIHTKEELHKAFAEQFGFPEWYGGNLDALHDCLTDIREKVIIRFVDYDELEEHLPIYGRLAVRVVRSACRDNPRLSCTVDKDGLEDDDEE